MDRMNLVRCSFIKYQGYHFRLHTFRMNQMLPKARNTNTTTARRDSTKFIRPPIEKYTQKSQAWQRECSQALHTAKQGWNVASINPIHKLATATLTSPLASAQLTVDKHSPAPCPQRTHTLCHKTGQSQFWGVRGKNKENPHTNAQKKHSLPQSHHHELSKDSALRLNPPYFS